VSRRFLFKEVQAFTCIYTMCLKDRHDCTYIPHLKHPFIKQSPMFSVHLCTLSAVTRYACKVCSIYEIVKTYKYMENTFRSLFHSRGDIYFFFLSFCWSQKLCKCNISCIITGNTLKMCMLAFYHMDNHISV
jgi:hypothetical protein